MISDADHILRSVLLDRNGGGSALSADGLAGWTAEQGILWLHLDVDNPASRDWLEASDVPAPMVEALLADETRPRSAASADGLLVVLRGVNTNPGEDAEDMVSIRLWIEPDRIVSTRKRRLLAVQDIAVLLEAGEGPASTGDFLVQLVEHMADRIGEFVNAIEDRLAKAEDDVEGLDPAAFRASVGGVRRQIAAVRRFLAPQRDALDRLNRQPTSVLTDADTHYLREESDRVTRYLEDLDLARELAVLLQEEHLGQIAQQQSTRMYVLSLVAAVFLPLSFLTGLLGMNVGGLPGIDDPSAFLKSVLAMAAIGAVLIFVFRWRRWF